MDITIISQRYAQALFDLALEMEILERVKDDMTLVLEVTRENPQFRRLLSSPIIPDGKKARILRSIFHRHVDKLTMRFLELVTHKDREVYLLDITKSFVNLYNKYKNILTVQLTTAAEINEKIREEIIDLLEDTTHKTIDLIEVVDDKIIGGFVLRMDDSQYDASIRKKISKLEKAFEKNLYIRGF